MLREAHSPDTRLGRLDIAIGKLDLNIREDAYLALDNVRGTGVDLLLETAEFFVNRLIEKKVSNVDIIALLSFTDYFVRQDVFNNPAIDAFIIIGTVVPKIDIYDVTRPVKLLIDGGPIGIILNDPTMCDLLPNIVTSRYYTHVISLICDIAARRGLNARTLTTALKFGTKIRSPVLSISSVGYVISFLKRSPALDDEAVIDFIFELDNISDGILKAIDFFNKENALQRDMLEAAKVLDDAGFINKRTLQALKALRHNDNLNMPKVNDIIVRRQTYPIFYYLYDTFRIFKGICRFLGYGDEYKNKRQVPPDPMVLGPRDAPASPPSGAAADGANAELPQGAPEGVPEEEPSGGSPDLVLPQHQGGN